MVVGHDYESVARVLVFLLRNACRLIVESHFTILHNREYCLAIDLATLTT